jgi:26S proteasome regulatory subunit T4
MCLPQLSDTFNGADLRNVVTESGMFAIREDRSVFTVSSPMTAVTFPENREYITQEDLTKAARKVGEAKKHES